MSDGAKTCISVLSNGGMTIMNKENYTCLLFPNYEFKKNADNCSNVLTGISHNLVEK